MKHIVLAGGGHSHIEVLRRFAIDRPQGVEITVVNPTPSLLYTGMLPGLVAGIYRLDECRINIAKLAQDAGAHWVAAAVTGLDVVSKILHLDNGFRLSYGILSLNIGAIPPHSATPGASDHTAPIKPMDEFFRWWEALLAQGRAVFPAKIAIVGAGAGGVELALAMEHRLRTLNVGGKFSEISLLTDHEDIMAGHNRLVKRWLTDILIARGIVVHRKAKVVSAQESCLRSADGRSFPFDYAVWTTGAAPASWASNCGLATDKRGFVSVDEQLRSTSHPAIFAAGDVATQINAPRPKAGVFAVRQGPVLAENLRRTVDGRSLVAYRPQRHALVLIGAGERYAVASRGLLALKGRWVWRWKERIDRRFVMKYRKDTSLP